MSKDRKLLNDIYLTSKEAIYDMEDGVPGRLAYEPVKRAVANAFKAGISPEVVDLKMRAAEKAALGNQNNS